MTEAVPYQQQDLRTVAVMQDPEPASQSISYPIYMSSNYQYADDVYDQIVAGERHDVNIYSRCGNPTEYRFEEQMTRLEGAQACLAVGSGMAAIAVTLFGLLKSGDHVIADWTTYSTTHELLLEKFPLFGVLTTFVDTSDLQAVERAFTPQTKVLYFETIANPTMKVPNIRALSDLAHNHGAVAVCDNTFASPVVCQPHRFGADIVLESATKFIGGHNDALGGTITELSGILPREWIETIRWSTLTKLGGVLSPFNAWLLLRGTQTLPVRVEAQSRNALDLARYLSGHPWVKRVWYPGLASHPQHDLARQQFTMGGGMLTFGVRDEATAVRVLKSLEVIAFAASLGGVRSVAQAPATMAFLDLPEEDRAKMGVSDGMIRISVGLENPDDLKTDLAHAFELAAKADESG
jgi:methionine-gamma-lyase